MDPSLFLLSQPGWTSRIKSAGPKELYRNGHKLLLRRKNDARDLLSLLAYAEKLQETQRNLEEVYSLMQHKVPLEGLICAQGNRTLQATKSCLKRLHVRVEALANVMEQTMITQQIQFMQDMAQHRQKSNDTDQIKSEPGDAPEVTSCQHNEWAWAN